MDTAWCATNCLAFMFRQLPYWCYSFI